jgi:hypothetical protein
VVEPQWAIVVVAAFAPDPHSQVSLEGGFSEFSAGRYFNAALPVEKWA